MQPHSSLSQLYHMMRPRKAAAAGMPCSFAPGSPLPLGFGPLHAERCTNPCCRWGLQFRAWHCVPTHAAGACGYVPDVIWMALTTPAAVIVAFRGADPFTQVGPLYQ